MNSSYQPYSYYTETCGRGWWDKYQHQPAGMHVEGKGEGKREYEREKMQGEKGVEKLKRKKL